MIAISSFVSLEKIGQRAFEKQTIKLTIFYPHLKILDPTLLMCPSAFRVEEGFLVSQSTIEPKQTRYLVVESFGIL